MRRWADDCPDNFLHCYYMVEGELSRVLGEDIEVVNKYEEAIKAAKKNDFKQFEALAHELAAKFWYEKENHSYSTRHINRAYRHYYQWGATRKLELMSKVYADILTVSENDTDFINSTKTASTDSGSNNHENLDLQAIATAAQSISQEIRFNSLLDKLAKTIIEVAGADKYILLLFDQQTNQLKIKSTLDLQIRHIDDTQVYDDHLAPYSLVQYAFRTGETVLIEEFSKDSRYQTDPYFSEHSPKSILCMPIQYQGELLGTLYLENNSATGAFTTPRLETLEILSTQAAISIHNAALYDSLDAQVKTRTKQLDALNAELEDRIQEQVNQIEQLNKLRRFLSPQVSNLIVDSGNESLLTSHRKEIAILFCDLRGFTAFSESVEPEESLGLLNNYHEALGELISKYDATIDHRAGDGLMLFLNDPIPCDDPVKKVVQLAIEMRSATFDLISDSRRHGNELGFGVGVSHGYATIGMIGYEGRFDYAATGRYVNLASRLCDIAGDGQILVPRKVHAEIANAFKTEFMGEHDIKGFHKPVATYNVLGENG